jgi:hypothetical protein
MENSLEVLGTIYIIVSIVAGIGIFLSFVDSVSPELVYAYGAGVIIQGVIVGLVMLALAEVLRTVRKIEDTLNSDEEETE